MGSAHISKLIRAYTAIYLKEGRKECISDVRYYGAYTFSGGRPPREAVRSLDGRTASVSMIALPRKITTLNHGRLKTVLTQEAKTGS